MKLKTLSKQISLAALLLTLFIYSSLAGTINLPLVPADTVASINAVELRKHLSFLASPELGGRYTFSSGNRIAARYLASQLESFGYRGAARDGGYLQTIEFAKRALNRQASRLQISYNGNNTEFPLGDEFYIEYPLAADLKGEVVFVGYGISAPDKGYDSYAGLDVKDKIVLIMSGKPKQLANEYINPQQRWLSAAQAQGARAALLMSQNPTQGLLRSAELILEHEPLGMIGEEDEAKAEPAQKPLPNAYLGSTAATALLQSLATNFEEIKNLAANGEALTSRPLPVTINMQIVIQQVLERAQNVAAIYEGTDVKLKQEYILISAHYDHIETENGQIFCGADDDGSGTAAVLTLARAFASGSHAKRSVLIVFHTGEELGLYGSRYFTNVEPLVPLESIVVNLNIDMIGRSRSEDNTKDRNLTDKNSIYLIGADKHSSELNKLSEQTNQELFGMRLDYTYNSEEHPLRLFYRSDHYNYARRGIPIIFYFTGLHSDYHRATDTIEKIDFEKMTRITRLIYATAWRIANLDHRLVIDHQQKKGQ